MIKLNNNKFIKTGCFGDIKPGDAVFTECDGPCSGGASYGIGTEVLSITKTDIITKDGKYCRKGGFATSAPTTYYISFWQEG